MKKSDFAYHLPESLIAQYPLPERRSSRLLCMNSETGQISDRGFNDFIGLLDKKDLLVFNNTKVIPARLFGKKQSGGKVEVLIERILGNNTAIAHVRSSKSPKSGAIIELDRGNSCTVLGRAGDLFEIKFSGEQDILKIVEQIGHMPLPPYIGRADNEADLSRYQTVFAREPGAVAAPTAGLHFDEDLLEKISAKGVKSVFVTLHVGSGTFQPVRVENLSEHVMHKEVYAVDTETVDAVNAARSKGGRIIAVGTTSVRALEAASKTGTIAPGFGETDLFITPGYRFRSVDAILTNFHLPESTLLMLVSAFAGYQTVMNAYRHAIEKEYRFFSYGDAMFLSPDLK